MGREVKRVSLDFNWPLNWVYLLHFDRPLSHAQHYIGFTSNLNKRITEHRTASYNGRPCKIMCAVYMAGITFSVARIWKIDDGSTEWNSRGRKFERQLKRRKNARLICPICSGDAAYNRGVYR